jgi:oligopeptide transport system permease protein
MMDNNEKFPRKRPFSLQMDLSKFSPATDEEKEQIVQMRESTTFFKDGIKKLSKDPFAMISIAVLLFIVLTIFIAPIIVPYSYQEMISVDGVRDRTAMNLAPFTYSVNEQAAIKSGEKIFPHIFGTDQLSRDYRFDLRLDQRLFRRKSGPGIDAYCRYYLCSAGYADDYSAGRCA